MMKWPKNKALALAGVCVFTLMWGISHAGITGVVDSKHDLSVLIGGSAFEFVTAQVCVFCHTPHGANPNMRTGTYWDESSKNYVQSGAPTLLWNRPLLANTSQSFKMYTSSSMTNPNNAYVGAYSLMCMSCHDGISAINVLSHAPGDMVDEDPADGYVDAFFGGPDQLGDVFTAGINIGERIVGSDPGFSDLRNDHPITIDYSVAYTAEGGPGGGLKPIDSSDGKYSYIDAAKKVRLFPHPNGLGTDSVECSSCHDVHNEGDPNPGGTYPFLTVTNNGSALCLACHNK